MAKEKEIIFKVEVKGADGSVQEIDKVAKSVDDFDTAIKQLQDQVNSLELGSDEYKKVSKDLKEAQKQFDKAKMSNQSFLTSLSEAPGPLGAVGRGIQGLKKGFDALAANPIVLIITALVAALVALYKAFTSTKAGAEKMEQIFAGISAALDVLRDRVLKVGGAIVKFFSGDFTGAFEDVKSAVSGIGDEIAAEFRAAAEATKKLQEVEDMQRSLNVERAKQNALIEEAKGKVNDENLSYDQRRQALNQVREAEIALALQEQKLAEERYKALKALADLSDSSKEQLDELAAAEAAMYAKRQETAAKQKELADQEKALRDKQKAEAKAAADAYKKIEDDILKKRQANLLQSIEDERERALKSIEIQRDNELESIKQLKATSAQKAALRAAAEEKYQLDLKAIEDKEIQRKKDLEQAIKEITADSYEEQLELAVAAEAKKYDELIKQAKGNTEQILLLEKAREDAVTQIRLDSARERSRQLEDLENEIAMAIATSSTERDAAEKEAKLDASRRYYEDLIAQAKANGMDTEALEKAKGEAVTAINDEYRKKELDAELAAFEAKKNIQMAQIGLVAQVAGLLSEIAGENKKLQIAAVTIEKAAAIGQILTSTSIANAKAVAASPLTAGQPWVAINSISAGLAIASTIAAGAKAISEINKADTEADTPSEGSVTAPTPSKFAKGGLLQGRLHAEGGVTSPFGELEGGEFVVNRASTANFLPLLEKINAMGVGQNVARNNMSASQEVNALQTQQMPIIKTYVVASEMSSQQEANKRIRDIASL